MKVIQYPEIKIYTDGAYSRSKKKGGFCALLTYKDKQKIVKGSDQSEFCTNNRMEIQAVISGLESIRKKSEIKIISDSTYVVHTINKWIWSFVSDITRPNHDLMVKLLNEMKKHESVSASWVRGHNGNPFNELVNEIAQKEAGTWKGKKK